MSQSPHVLIFEPRTEGHHPGWLRFIVEDLLANGFRLTLAVDQRPERFGRIRDHLGELLTQATVLDISTHGGLIKGGSKKLSCLHACFEASGADHIFMAALDEIASFAFRRAAFGLKPPQALRGRFGGIYHRPRLLDPAMHSLNQRLKRMGYRRLMTQGVMRPILFVDPYIWRQEQDRFRDLRLYYLPDPCPEEVAGDSIAARRQLGLPANKRVLLFFGGGSRRKGLHLAAEAMLQVTDASALLLCAGQQEPATSTAKALRFLAEKGRALVLDRYVSAEEERLCFRASDVVLLPYVNHFGTSGVLSRAMAAGKMVIASDEQLLGRLVRDHNIGLLFTSGSAENLRLRIGQALQLGPFELSQYGEAALRYARQHSRQTYREVLARALRETLAR